MTGGFLFDMSALSRLAPGRSDLPAGVADRLRAEAHCLYLSTITLAEIREGICKLRRKRATARADAIKNWFARLCATFSDRVLPFGIAEAEVAGRLADEAVGIGRHPGFADTAIAATAKANGLTVVTQNTGHFEPLTGFGVAVTDLAGLA